MGGSSKSGGNEAKQARADEQARQDKIRQGTDRINSIFNGGTFGSGALGANSIFDPKATYYLSDGSVWAPTPYEEPVKAPVAPTVSNFYGGGTGGGNVSRGGKPSGVLQGVGNAHGQMQNGNVPGQRPGNTPSTGTPKQQPLTPEQQFKEMLAGGKLFSGTSKRNGFDDAFFKNRRQAYIDYASPQLEDQYGDAQKQLTFALDRGGLLDSSVRGDKVAELQKKYDLNKQQIADQALASETDARNAVEDARANLIATLNATGDATGTANAALARASALSKPAAYSPLTNLFADFTGALGTQAALEKANAFAGSGAGGPQIGRYNTGLFSSGSKSVVSKA